MSNDFFDNHPMLGSVFDFDRDGSLSLGEAAAIGAFGALYADEMMRAEEEAEREARRSRWDDDGGDSCNSKNQRSISFLASGYDDEDDSVDTSSRSAVMRAVMEGDSFGDTECLVAEALDHGVRFRPEDIIDLSREIFDKDLFGRLISTSSPRFQQEDADDLAPHWAHFEIE